MDVNVSHSTECNSDAEEPGGCLWQYCNASEEREASCYDPRTLIGPITEPARCILLALAYDLGLLRSWDLLCGGGWTVLDVIRIIIGCSLL